MGPKGAPWGKAFDSMDRSNILQRLSTPFELVAVGQPIEWLPLFLSERAITCGP